MLALVEQKLVLQGLIGSRRRVQMLRGAVDASCGGYGSGLANDVGAQLASFAHGGEIKRPLVAFASTKE